MANLIVNPDFESGTGSTSSVQYINGVANRNYLTGGSAGATASFDTTVKRSGSQSLKFALGSSGAWHTIDYINLTDYATYSIPASASTSYTFSGYIKTDGVTIDSANGGVYIYELDSSGNYISGTDVTIGSLPGTQDWTLVTRTWTTNAACVYIHFQAIRIHGHNGSMYADDFNLDLAVTAHTKDFTENIVISESFSKAITRSITDGIVNLTDNIVKASTRTLTDTGIALSEAYSTIKGYIREFTETDITLTDNYSDIQAKSLEFTDTVNKTDTIQKDTTRSLSDSIVKTDDITKASTRSISETINITEVFGVAYAYLREFSETINITESFSKIFGFIKSYTDTINKSDSIEKTQGKNLTDNVSISDSIRRMLNGVLMTIWTLSTKATSTWTKLTKATSTWTKAAKSISNSWTIGAKKSVMDD